MCFSQPNYSGEIKNIPLDLSCFECQQVPLFSKERSGEPVSSLGQLHSLFLRAKQLVLVTLEFHNEILRQSLHRASKFQKGQVSFATWKVYLIRRCFSSPGAGSQTPGRQLFWPSHSTNRLSSTWRRNVHSMNRNHWPWNWLPHTGKASERKYIPAPGTVQQEAPNQTDSGKRTIWRDVMQA